jgi:hypothetical protein
MNHKEKLEIYERAQRIVKSDLEWDEKYDMIFSTEVSQRFDFDWYDPDCGYEDDVWAFMSAFDEYMKKQLIIRDQIDFES